MTKGWQENNSTLFEDIKRIVGEIASRQETLCKEHFLYRAQITHLEEGKPAVCQACGNLIKPEQVKNLDDYTAWGTKND